MTGTGFSNFPRIICRSIFLSADFICSKKASQLTTTTTTGGNSAWSHRTTLTRTIQIIYSYFLFVCPSLGAFLALKKVRVPRVPRLPRVFDVRPPIRFTTSWTNANIGGTLEGVHRKKMNEPSDDSEVVNNSSEEPDQVQARK